MVSGPNYALSKDKAIEIFSLLSGIGYGVAIKHLRGNYYIEIPVRLRGDKAYRAEWEITRLMARSGYQVLQAGNILRVA